VVARIDVGVKPARKPLERTLDVVRRRIPIKTEQYVEIHGIADCRFQIADLFRLTLFNLQSAIINLQSPVTAYPRPPLRHR
jgi:hypothetical protein